MKWYTLGSTPKQFIEGIVKLEKTMNMSNLVESIFDYKNKNGLNCIIASIDMIGWYKIKTGNFPDSSMPMFNETESTVLFLIKLAEDNKLNINNILNWVPDNGQTLFWKAAFFTESLALKLLSRNVDVKTVDHKFETVSFRVSQLFC